MNPSESRPLFTRSEEHEVRQTISRGEAPRCPRCEADLVSQRVEPRADVAYVRHRTWWLCPVCHRGVVVDRRP